MDGTKVSKDSFTKDHFITRAWRKEKVHELAEVQPIISVQPFTVYNQKHQTKSVALNWPHSFLRSATSDTRDKSRSKLLNQRQADSKWRACRQRVLPCCCWKGRSPPTPDTICGRRDKKTPPEMEENQPQQGAWQDSYYHEPELSWGINFKWESLC